MRRLVIILSLIIAAWAVWALVSLPPPALALQPPAAPAGAPPSVRGAYHIHSRASDGTGTIPDIAAAAARAGLQFIIVTDHGDGLARPRAPRYLFGVLCIEAVEISTTDGHYAALGMSPPPFPAGRGGPRRGRGRCPAGRVRRGGPSRLVEAVVAVARLGRAG